MDKSEGRDWFAKTLNNVTEETAKIYKISRLKLEIATLNKTKSEKMGLLGKRLMELLKSGRIDRELFEPEYSGILDIDSKTEEMQNEINEIKKTLKIGFGNSRRDAEEDSFETYQKSKKENYPAEVRITEDKKPGAEADKNDNS